KHPEIFDPAALGEEFGLSWELETGFVHTRLVNRPGHNRIELAASRECDRFFERSRCGTRGFDCRLAWFALRLPANGDVFGEIGNASCLQGEVDNLRPNPGAIGPRDSDARSCRAH